MVEYKKEVQRYVHSLKTDFLPSLEFGFVIFGFHDGQLKVLLNHLPVLDHWALPTGRIGIREELEEAAYRSLRELTGLKDVYLKQFQTFGKLTPVLPDDSEELLIKLGLTDKDIEGIPDRVITLGYYALVEYTKVEPTPSVLYDECRWWDMDQIPSLLFDHNTIIKLALKMPQQQLSYQPIGYNLLPETFTMTELQRLYETILGLSLNRRNFYKQMMNYNVLERLEERKSIGAHKSPYLYRFNIESYNKLLSEERLPIV